MLSMPKPVSTRTTGGVPTTITNPVFALNIGSATSGIGIGK